jgi:hypothetical protein
MLVRFSLVNERPDRCWPSCGLCPQTPRIYRIMAKGKWQVPGRRLLQLHAPCTCRRHRLGAQVATQHYPSLRPSAFFIVHATKLCKFSGASLAFVCALTICVKSRPPSELSSPAARGMLRAIPRVILCRYVSAQKRRTIRKDECVVRFANSDSLCNLP